MDPPASRPNWLKLNLDGAKDTESRHGFPESSALGNRFGRQRSRKKFKHDSIFTGIIIHSLESQLI
jgi:hypothetical protein